MRILGQLMPSAERFPIPTPPVPACRPASPGMWHSTELMGWPSILGGFTCSGPMPPKTIQSCAEVIRPRLRFLRCSQVTPFITMGHFSRKSCPFCRRVESWAILAQGRWLPRQTEPPTVQNGTNMTATMDPRLQPICSTPFSFLHPLGLGGSIGSVGRLL